MAPRFIASLLLSSTVLLATIASARPARAELPRSAAFRAGRALSPAEVGRTRAHGACGIFAAQRADAAGGAPLELGSSATEPRLGSGNLALTSTLLSTTDDATEERPMAASTLTRDAMRRTGAELPFGFRLSASYAFGRRLGVTAEHAILTVPGEPATRMHASFLRVGLAL